MELKSGIVTRVVWAAEDSDRRILLVRYETPGGLVDATVIANARDAAPGMWFSAQGEWKRRAWQGRDTMQFHAKSFHPEMPSTAEGCAAYLEFAFSFAAHGIDRAAIAAFVAKHGPDCCRKAEATPEILVSMSSNPAVYRAKILADWGRRVSNRRAVVLMEGAGLDRFCIGRILDAFRDATWEMLCANPYKVSRVPKVGFETAEKIGVALRIPPDDRRRLDAAFVSLLDRAKEEGSTVVPAAALLQQAQDRFRLDPSVAKAWLKDVAGRQEPPAIVDRAPDGIVVQTPELFNAEAYVGRASVRLLENGRRNREDAAASGLGRIVQKPEFSRFDEVQREAILRAVVEPFSVLTGGPGTGKTTVTRAVADLAEALGERSIILAAPTGKAAKRMQEATGRPAQTIHRMLSAEEDRRTGGSVFRINRERPLPAGCFVVVDEASMLDVETMGAIVDALPPDGRLLLVGDRNQLPSVGAGNVLADLLRAEFAGGRKVVPATELVNVYRQKGNSAIATGAAQIRDGLVPPMDNTVRGGLTMLEHKAPQIVDKISHLLRVGGFVREKLGLDPRRDVAILCPQAPGQAGTWEINRRLSLELNPEGRPIEGVVHGPEDDKRIPLPRVGDRVMMTENDDENDVMNGDSGTIVDAVEVEVGGRRQRVMRIAFDCHAEEGRTVDYPVTRWRSLILSYACTVHKSQGSQWPCVILPVTMAHENMLDRTLLYTGWTRAQDILLVVGEREAVEHSIGVVKATGRSTRLREFVERVAAESPRLAARASERPAPVGPAAPPPSVSAPFAAPPAIAAPPQAPAAAPAPVRRPSPFAPRPAPSPAVVRTAAPVR